MKQKLFIFIAIIIAIGSGLLIYLRFIQEAGNQNQQTSGNADENLTIEVEEIVNGLDHPWDIKQSDNGSLYFTQRGSGLYKYQSEEIKSIYQPPDLYSAGEGGMLGFDLAPDFEQDREVFACFNSKKTNSEISVIVSKLTLNKELNGIEDREDIVTDIPSAQSGRHSGCRVLFDKKDSDIIWITTGDAADGSNPQDPQNLGGKVLRINKQGKGVEGNLSTPFDPRIFSYGHRNLQGLTLFSDKQDQYGFGLTAEHGPDVDDEVNPLVKGNFGWDPDLPYDESVPMTDKEKFPEAVDSVWSSGNRTIAMCGIEYLEKGPWEGNFLLAALKDRYILRFKLNKNDQADKIEEVVNQYGRIRQVYQSESGRIFFTTDNGGNDIIGEIVLQ